MLEKQALPTSPMLKVIAIHMFYNGLTKNWKTFSVISSRLILSTYSDNSLSGPRMVMVDVDGVAGH